MKNVRKSNLDALNYFCKFLTLPGLFERILGPYDEVSYCVSIAFHQNASNYRENQYCGLVATFELDNTAVAYRHQAKNLSANNFD